MNIPTHPSVRAHVEDVADVHPLEQLWAGISCTALRVASYRWAPDWRVTEWVAANHVLVVSARGEASFRLAGQACRLPDGGALLVPPNVAQSAAAVPGSTEMTEAYVVHFVARLCGMLDAPELLGLPMRFTLTQQRHDRIIEAVTRLITEVASRRPGAALAANGECMIVLAMLWRDTVERERHTVPAERSNLAQLARMAPVFKAIQLRYSQEIRLAELARVVHLHPAHFSRVFRETTGLTPFRYVARYRLSRARELLAGTELTIEEVARRTGHGSASYLTRVFRQEEGMPPGKFRKTVGVTESGLYCPNVVAGDRPATPTNRNP